MMYWKDKTFLYIIPLGESRFFDSPPAAWCNNHCGAVTIRFTGEGGFTMSAFTFPE